MGVIFEGNQTLIRGGDSFGIQENKHPKYERQ